MRMRTWAWLAVIGSACLFFLLFLLVLGSLVVVVSRGRSVAFQSRESKTREGLPVFNEVRFLPGREKDVWVMRQSHSGHARFGHSSDRLAIVVDHRTRTARFLQFEPRAEPFEGAENGALFGNETERDFAVSCGLCHANGPRALRPAPAAFWASGSGEGGLSALDALVVFLWNLRIKSYGRLDAVPSSGRVPFSPSGAFWNRELTVPACQACHGGEGPFARAPLRRAHFLSIAFLLNEGAMPPPTHRLSLQDRTLIEAFLAGTPAHGGVRPGSRASTP